MKRTVWVNITTSATWLGNAVGVLRVEQMLATMLPTTTIEHNVRFCVWTDGTFVDVGETYSLLLQDLQTKRVAQKGKKSIASIIARYTLGREMKRLCSGAKRALSRTEDARQKIRFANKRKARKALYPQASIKNLPFKIGDILISMGLDWDYPYQYCIEEIKAKTGITFVSCCYDLIPILSPHYCASNTIQFFTDYMIRLINNSDHVLCISKQTEKDLLKFASDTGCSSPRTSVCYLGDTISKNSVSSWEIEATHARHGKFIIFVSTIERRKNHEIIYKAYEHLVSQGITDLPKVIFIGRRGWGVSDLLKEISLNPSLKNYFEILDSVTDEQLDVYYASAEFCLYPSLYEGWGLPVAEALLHGKLVLSSGKASLPEVGLDLVKYLDPTDAHAWAECILHFHTNEGEIHAAQNRVRAEYRPRKWQDFAQHVTDQLSKIR